MIKIKRCKCVMCSTIVDSNPSDSHGIDSTGKPYYLCNKCYASNKLREISREFLNSLKVKRNMDKFVNDCIEGGDHE